MVLIQLVLHTTTNDEELVVGYSLICALSVCLDELDIGEDKSMIFVGVESANHGGQGDDESFHLPYIFVGNGS